MSSQKNNLKSFIKKAMLSTASSTALIFAGGEALATAVPAGVIAINNNANFSDSAAAGNWQGVTDQVAATGIPRINEE